VDKTQRLSFPVETHLGQTMHNVPALAVPVTGDDGMMTIDGGTLCRPTPDRRRSVATVLPYGERRAIFR